MNIAIIGAGWAGMAAAVRAAELGHRVTVFEAGRQLGGRARGVPLALPDGRELMVDNGQHMLIGAYTECLRLMRRVGIDPAAALLRLPLTLRFADGTGVRLPDLPAPLDAIAGVLTARGWSWPERAALLRTARHWRRHGFRCDEGLSVAQLCAPLPPRLMAEFIEPLCVSALNTPIEQASAATFLRVLHDGMFASSGGSNALLPRIDLGELFPRAAARWLQVRGGTVATAHRIESLRRQAAQWLVGDRPFDRAIVATAAPAAARLVGQAAPGDDDSMAERLAGWSRSAARLPHHAISTVYAQADAPVSRRTPLLPVPMLALRSSESAPAQFVFDHDTIRRPEGATRLLAFVISLSRGERASLEAAVVTQARRQLGLAVIPLLSVTEKRATFACTPGLQRPGAAIAPGLWACGDYVDGPYPATLEGAVRSGLRAAEALQ